MISETMKSNTLNLLSLLTDYPPFNHLLLLSSRERYCIVINNTLEADFPVMTLVIR